MELFIKEEEVENKNIEEVEEPDLEMTDEEFDEVLDELYEPYEMGFLTFYASDILKEMDPIAYRETKNNYEPSKLEYHCPICSMEYSTEEDAKWCCQDETVTIYKIVDKNDNIVETFETKEDAQDYVDENATFEYKVRVFLMDLDDDASTPYFEDVLSIEASNEDEAIERGKDLAYDLKEASGVNVSVGAQIE